MRPAVPVVLGQRVFDGHQGVLPQQALVERGQPLRRALGALEPVAAIGMELGRGDVEREGDVGAQGEPGAVDGHRDQVERLGGRGQVGGEPALVAQPGRQALLLQYALERVVGLGAPPQRLAEGLGADRRDHELLDVDAAVGVRAAVDDVHHRHRQDVGVRATDVAEQRQLRRLGRGAGDSQRDAEDRVGADLGLVVGAVQVDHRLVDQPLLGGVQPQQRRAQVVEHREHSLLDTLAAVAAGVAVATLGRLERAGGGTRGHARAGDRAVVQGHLDLDGGVAARVQDLAGADGLDAGHG